MNTLIHAIFLLIGTTIGAGIFVLPYVFSRSGLLPSAIGLVFLGLVILCVNYFYSQVILDTSGDRQLPGYVKKYFGEAASKVALVVMLVSLYGALIAYCSLAGEFLHMIFDFGSVSLFIIIFIHVGMLFFLKGIKVLAKIQSWLVCVMILLLLVVPLVLLRSVDVNNFTMVGKLPLFFWGSTFFSLTGFSVIPEMEEVLRNKKGLLVPAIVIGSIVPVILYAGFAFG
ncbi:MAG: aromatic amino acid transport family protein, partial [Patescibacteria group bacterium]|nr:aromatic amino acid transport family protein [Patescibacteria group bacterium]